MTTIPEPPRSPSKKIGQTSSAGADSSPGPWALAGLSAEFGIDLARWDLDVFRLAADVQRRRRDSGKTKRYGVTRSVLLWAICALSDSIRAALASVGLDMRTYEKLLGGFDGSEVSPSGGFESAIMVEPELVSALRAFLSFEDDVTNLDLGRALIRSAAYDDAGLLGSRLRKLNVDVDAAADILTGLSPSPSRRTPAEAEVRTSPADVDQSREVESDSAEWSPDSPATEDLLGRAALAESLAARLRRVDEGPFPPGSFLVHIDGPWGSGKSSLFTFLEEELKDSFLVVSVNAWRDQRVGVQWWTLLSALQRAIAREAGGFGRLRMWAQGLFDRLRARWVPFAAAVTVVLGLGIGILVYGLDKTRTEVVLGWISIASVTFAGVVAAARYLLPGAKRSAESLIEHSENPMREIVRLFATTLKRAKRPVVFLIDDLDRCDAEYVVEFLEVMQTLVRGAPGFINDDERARGVRLKRRALHRATREDARVARVKGDQHREKRRKKLDERRKRRSSRREMRHEWVLRWQGWRNRWRLRHGKAVVAPRTNLTGPHGFVAADGRWIRASYERHYQEFGASSTPGRPLGYLFLEKIFQLRVLVPPVSPAARDTYMAALLRTRSREPSPNQAAVVADAESEVDRASTEEGLISAQESVEKVQNPVEHMRLLAKIAVRHSEKGVEDATINNLAEFAVFVDQNPRSMKLFVNTYRVLRSLRTLQSLRPKRKALALWTVIEIRWPELADYLRDDPATIDDVIAGRELSERARELLSQDGVLTVLRHPGWGGLNSEVVRECAGLELPQPRLDAAERDAREGSRSRGREADDASTAGYVGGG